MAARYISHFTVSAIDHTAVNFVIMSIITQEKIMLYVC